MTTRFVKKRTNRVLETQGQTLTAESSGDLLFLLIGIFVPIFTSGNIFGSIAHFSFVIVDFTGLAAQITRIFTVQADIEFLAIGGMRISGMGDNLTAGISLWLILGAFETTGGFLCERQNGDLLFWFSQKEGDAKTYWLRRYSFHVWQFRARHRYRCIHRSTNQQYTWFPKHHHQYS